MPTTRKHYDSIFKKILTLSSKAVINMINCLFNMYYDPENSTVSYHWTENVHDNQNSMTTTLADTILVINKSVVFFLVVLLFLVVFFVFRVFYLTAPKIRIFLRRRTTFHLSPFTFHFIFLSLRAIVRNDNNYNK